MLTTFTSTLANDEDPSTMKAAQFFGQRDIRVVEVPTPEPNENEALVAIEWCGICGSDLSEFRHGISSYFILHLVL